MISIRLGNVGSGKTAAAVREMMLNQSKRKTYTNIRTIIKNCELINPSMIITKEISGYSKKGEAKYDYTLNVDFWKNINEPINIVLDEVHTILNARRSMSKVNIILTDWMALIRRVLGQAESGYGELVLISQLHNRIDIVAREMATNVRYHICHYLKSCLRCGNTWAETSESPEPRWICSCGSYRIKKHNHKIEVWHFAGMDMYIKWKEWGINTYHQHYLIDDIENYFKLYDTLQWDNLFSEFY